jgi:hypothetical protein
LDRDWLGWTATGPRGDALEEADGNDGESTADDGGIADATVFGDPDDATGDED